MAVRTNLFISSLAFAIVLALPAVAQNGSNDDSFERERENCIRVSNIRNTTIVDENSIVFHMRGDLAYRNFLRSRCPGLRRNTRLDYQVRGGRLCSTDVVYAADSLDRRFGRGTPCLLGDFEPITADEAERIRRGEPASAGEAELVITEIEIPPEEQIPNPNTGQAESNSTGDSPPE